ncbi:MAG: transposase family protein [Candidatus Phosphoribacter sp.]
MPQPAVDAASDAASILFNLPAYRVIAVTRDEAGGREVFVDTPATEAGCPGCGVLSRVHQRTVQRVRDVPFDGPLVVWWVKKRWRCTEPVCAKATFAEHTAQVPPYARPTTRLKERIVTALSGRSAACRLWPSSSGSPGRPRCGSSRRR